MTPLMADGADRFYPVCGPGEGYLEPEGVTSRVLAIGGTVDHWWDAKIARSHGFAINEVEGGDHSLQIRGDWRASIHVVEDVTAQVQAFMSGTAGTP